MTDFKAEPADNYGCAVSTSSIVEYSCGLTRCYGNEYLGTDDSLCFANDECRGHVNPWVVVIECSGEYNDYYQHSQG